jgi:hypothetical protein
VITMALGLLCWRSRSSQSITVFTHLAKDYCDTDGVQLFTVATLDLDDAVKVTGYAAEELTTVLTSDLNHLPANSLALARRCSGILLHISLRNACSCGARSVNFRCC